MQAGARSSKGAARTLLEGRDSRRPQSAWCGEGWTGARQRGWEWGGEEMRVGGEDRRTIWQASRRPITWRGRGGDSKAPLEPSRAATAQANARGERDRARKCARGAAEEVRDRPSSAWPAGVPKLPACERASADRLPRLVGGSGSEGGRRTRRIDDARRARKGDDSDAPHRA